MLLPIALTFAAGAILIDLWLGARISMLRLKGGHMMGDDGNPALLARMRAQSNFVEYTPFALIAVALIELAGGNATWLWVAVAVFLVARLAHATGMDRPAPNPFRAGGIAFTLLTLALLAGWAAWLAWAGGVAAPHGGIELLPPSA